MKDLFGKEVTVEVKPGHTWRRKTTPARGYAATPGTGPKGETCKTCCFSYRRHGGTRHYWKCGHDAAPEPNHGPGTDIRINWMACRYWKPKEVTDGAG